MYQEASQSWREDKGLSQFEPALLLFLHVKGYRALIWASCHTPSPKAVFALRAAVCEDPWSFMEASECPPSWAGVGEPQTQLSVPSLTH